jgi:RNA polymerase sigma factor (sigma-70 family)
MDAQAELRIVQAAKAGDRDALDLLMRELWPSITRQCLGCRRSNQMPLDDLRQECAIAVLGCLTRFDVQSGIRFSTFAQKRISGAIADWWRQQLPPGARRHRGKSFRRRTVHLSTLSSEEFGAWQIADPDPEATRFEEQEWFESLLDTMAERERIVLAMRAKGRTMKEIGATIGLSESRVSQMFPSLQETVRQRIASGEWTPERPRRLNGRQTNNGVRRAMEHETQPLQTPSIESTALAICRATSNDLAALDQRISEAEQILAALKDFRRLLNIRINGKLSSQSKGTRKKSGEVGTAIEQYVKEHGPATVADIALAIGVKSAAVGAVVRHSRNLARMPDGRVDLLIPS